MYPLVPTKCTLFKVVCFMYENDQNGTRTVLRYFDSNKDNICLGMAPSDLMEYERDH